MVFVVNGFHTLSRSVGNYAQSDVSITFEGRAYLRIKKPYYLRISFTLRTVKCIRLTSRTSNHRDLSIHIEGELGEIKLRPEMGIVKTRKLE